MEPKIPIKWQKHLVLPRFGLRTMEDLESEIHRFRNCDLEKMKTEIEKQIENGEQNLYTISLVKPDQLHKLPNVSVTNSEELKTFYNNYKQDYRQYAEYWYCKKKIGPKQLTCIGRISFNLADQLPNKISLENAQIIEQVWNTSHRDIEKYNDKYNKAYIRSHRIGWGRRYKIDILKEPENDEVKRKQMVEQYIQVVKEIENKKENIEEFLTYLKKLGINELSLEYILEGSKFSFIDWDSQNDLKVINGIKKDVER